MPWPKAHKAATRARIVRAAAAAFRARGVSGVRVDEIMASVGLTHGGFYSHFASKDELLAAALEQANAETLDLLRGALAAAGADQRLQAAIAAYLSPWHAAHPDRGCPVPALGPELARMPGKTRRRLAQTISSRLDWMRGLGAGRATDDVAAGEIVGVLACMVGGVMLARAAGGDSAAILDGCRAFLDRALAGGPADGRPKAKPRRRAGRAARTLRKTRRTSRGSA